MPIFRIRVHSFLKLFHYFLPWHTVFDLIQYKHLDTLPNSIIVSLFIFHHQYHILHHPFLAVYDCMNFLINLIHKEIFLCQFTF